MKRLDTLQFKRWTNVFLLNAQNPTQIVLLKRAATKKFAPNLYTGIGGAHEEGESIEEAAYRELKEETGIENVKLHEFARAIITNTQKVIHYYWAIYDHVSLPECNEGNLEWVDRDKIFEKPIIPTTGIMLELWCDYEFDSKPFTVVMHRIEDANGMATEIHIDSIQNSLL